ncbi:DUF6230 family protein [Actinoplanes sp. KI2]|uniref:DUF6230 family protein n=1 Tax=Actinoplanes sp. KI2 TaxID=2983315 RepID=UPI0021D5F366|nr:DUF6230 family protein [Actinoplanes sp. KI2]MCU7728644.1 DUF6230 family protein [Actinoplanes sp. KI2]
MKDSQDAVTEGRTNWRRFAVAVGVPTVVAGGLVVALAQGALAASFSISGQSFHLTASSLDGTGFTQYSGSDLVTSTNSRMPVAKSGIKSATIHDLCQSVVGNIPGTSIPISLRIEAGKTADNKAVQADNLLIGMSDLSGDATFTNINIGQDASTLDQAGSGVPAGDVGGFGQGADKVHIDNLRQTATSTSASTFVLQGMNLHLYVGQNKDCFNG